MDFNAAEAKALVDVLTAHNLPTDDATVHRYHEINDALWKALERGETTQPKLKVERFRQLLEHLGMPGDPVALGAAYAANLGNYADLLLGVNIGGAGTLIASLASLITFREYASHNPGKTGRYVALFSAFNFLFLGVLTGFVMLIGA